VSIGPKSSSGYGLRGSADGVGGSTGGRDSVCSIGITVTGGNLEIFGSQIRVMDVGN
jgi:hypothetical protein